VSSTGGAGQDSSAELHGLFSTMQDKQQQILEAVFGQQQYMEQNHAWMEQRLKDLERRCERVEKASDRVYTTLQGIDFEDMRQDQREMLERSQALSSPGGAASTISNQSRVGGPDRRLERQVESLAEQVSTLLAHAEETSEMRRMLWKIDLQLRQLRSESSSNLVPALGNSPQAPSPAQGNGNARSRLPLHGGGSDNDLRSAAIGTPSRRDRSQTQGEPRPSESPEWVLPGST